MTDLAPTVATNLRPADADHGDPGAEVLGYGNAECQCHPEVRLLFSPSPPRPRAELFFDSTM